MIVYKDDVGLNKKFQILEPDGETPKVLTGLAVKWKFKDRDGNTISKDMTVDDDTQGMVSFETTSDISATVKRWTCQLEIYQGSTFIEKTDPFIVDIVSKT